MPFLDRRAGLRDAVRLFRAGLPPRDPRRAVRLLRRPVRRRSGRDRALRGFEWCGRGLRGHLQCLHPRVTPGAGARPRDDRPCDGRGPARARMCRRGLAGVVDGEAGLRAHGVPRGHAVAHVAPAAVCRGGWPLCPAVPARSLRIGRSTLTTFHWNVVRGRLTPAAFGPRSPRRGP